MGNDNQRLEIVNLMGPGEVGAKAGIPAGVGQTVFARYYDCAAQACLGLGKKELFLAPQAYVGLYGQRF